MKPLMILMLAALSLFQCCKEAGENVQSFFSTGKWGEGVHQGIESELLKEIRLNRMTSESMLDALSTNPELYTKALLVRKQTEITLDFIKTFREELIVHAEIYYRSGKAVNLARYQKQMEFTIGEEKDGKAYELQYALNDYVDKVNKIGGELFVFQHFALDGWQIDDDLAADLKKKDFAHLNFEKSSNLVCLTILRQFQQQVTALEVAALTKLFKANEEVMRLVDNPNRDLAK